MTRSKKSKKTNKIKLYLEFIPFVCLYKALRLMPLKVAYGISRSVFFLLYHLEGKSRRRAIQHLMHTGVAKDIEEAKKMSYAVFKHGARLMTELVKIDQNVSKIKVSFTGNMDSVNRLLMSGENNTPAILVTAHYGNWEVSGRLWTKYSSGNLLTVVRSINNPLIDNYISMLRSTEKHKVIPKTDSLKHMLKALRSKSSVAIISDQHASSNEGVETVFFGHPARTHASAALLHLKTKVPIAVMVLRCKDEFFSYEADFSDIIEYKATDDKEKDLATVTQMYTSELEKLIRKDPTQWLWTHRRWLDINRKKRKPVIQEINTKASQKAS
jgi:Kdo2-lipid IVA lauroyltransferase/acyltransferase